MPILQDTERRIFVVAEVNVKFHAPARLNEDLVVTAGLVDRTRVSFDIEQHIYRNSTDGDLLISGIVVLTGLIAGLITQGMEIGAAASAGVSLHGLAADALARKGTPVGYLATDVMDAVPEALQELLSGNDDPHRPLLDSLSYPTHQFSP